MSYCIDSTSCDDTSRISLIIKDTTIEEAEDLSASLFSDQCCQLILIRISNFHYILILENQVVQVFRSNSWYSTKHVLWQLVESSLLPIHVALFQSNVDSFDRVRFFLLLFELLEDFCGLVW